MSQTRPHPRNIIAHKRDGGRLDPRMIADYVEGVVDGSWGDAQIGAFLMAVCLQGMTVEETRALTLEMRDSGRVLDLAAISGVKVDKHSTGGVGDKVSLPLAAAVAACGVPVPMIAGRGLGHTGGTIDKLAAIPGYSTDLDEARFLDVLRRCGFVISAATKDIAPADRRTYQLRDVSGTVESIPLITASILSKKLAEGIDALVMDIKCGRAAFMVDRAQAEALLHSIVETGRAAGIRVSAFLTDMDTPLGCALGNALEVRESIECLRGEGPSDLRQLVVDIGGEMLRLGRAVADHAEACSRIEAALDGGEALDAFARNIAAQGGDARCVETPGDVLPQAEVVRRVCADDVSGFVDDIEPKELGLVVCDLGGGRRQPSDTIDPGVGVVLRKKLGDAVARGDVLAEIHASSESAAAAVEARVRAAFRVAERAPQTGSVVLSTLRDESGCSRS